MASIVKPLSFVQLGLYEYLLVAQTDAALNNKVIAERENFSAKYQQAAMQTLSHITIAGFLAREAMEETILRYTSRICSYQPGFKTALNNYSGFPPHTIYLRVQDDQPFKQLAKELKVVSNYVNSCSCPPVKLSSHPHVSIATQLPEHIYFKAMMDYSQKTFHETFTVDKLVLLRRSNQYEECKPIYVFRLRPPGFSALRNTSFN